MKRILTQDPEDFLRKPTPLALQRALSFLCFATLTSGGVCIDGSHGPGTDAGLAMFGQEFGRADWASLLDAVSNKAQRLGEEHVAVSSFFLDRIQAGRLMSLHEHYVSYFSEIETDDRVKKSGIDPMLLLAIAYVETGGVPSFRFEKHIWNRKADVSDLCRRRHLSTSFGLWQVMGFNLEALGYACDALEDMAHIEAQLEIVVEFIRKTPRLYAGCLGLDWPKIAYHYNGPAYRKNRYDAKLKTTHRKLIHLSKG